jgi:hypothetical protein
MNAAPRKRGPKKGDGGRPRLTLYDDPDRWIIVAAMWLRGDPKERRSLATLQALDFLLTPYDSITVELGHAMRDGREWGRLSMENTAPPRAVSANAPPTHRPLSAPSGRAFRRSRLQLLRKKIDHYRRAKLTKQEALFHGLSFLALDFISHGEGLKASAILQRLGWDMNEATRLRLAEIIDGPGRSAAII